MFLASKIFLGTGPQIFVEPKFLYRGYKIEHTFRHVAKFRGDRLTILRDLVAKKETLKHKTFPNHRSGWPNNRQ